MLDSQLSLCFLAAGTGDGVKQQNQTYTAQCQNRGGGEGCATHPTKRLDRVSLYQAGGEQQTAKKKAPNLARLYGRTTTVNQSGIIKPLCAIRRGMRCVLPWLLACSTSPDWFPYLSVASWPVLQVYGPKYLVCFFVILQPQLSWRVTTTYGVMPGSFMRPA